MGFGENHQPSHLGRIIDASAKKDVNTSSPGISSSFKISGIAGLAPTLADRPAEKSLSCCHPE